MVTCTERSRWRSLSKSCIGHWSYQVRLITYDYQICAKIPKASSPSKNCGLNDKSLAGHDILGH
ncbi:MAG: hypothetical protein V7K77_06630 [Nostoc sp.]|uniref:hypothetical protein n=1 Tax=Nostoc sp. TaxID=1180 RepID=UPI002FFB2016